MCVTVLLGDIAEIKSVCAGAASVVERVRGSADSLVSHRAARSAASDDLDAYS